MNLQTKSPYTLRFTTSAKYGLNRSCTKTQWNHKNKQCSRQKCNACYVRLEHSWASTKESRTQNSKSWKFKDYCELQVAT